MPPVSRFKLKEQILDKLFSLFFEIVGKNNRKEFDFIIKDILSTSERIMIAKRIAIIYLLIKKIDYTIICENLKVSPATVFKFRFILERSPEIADRYYQIISKEKLSEFLEDIYLTLRGPGVPGVNWSAAWSHKRDLERRKKEGI